MLNQSKNVWFKGNRFHNTLTVLIISIILLPAAISLAADAPVPKTGQTTCYDAIGSPVACSGTGQDGELKAGVAWPNPRFTDQGDGTVKDNLTGLVWLKDVSCADLNGSTADKNTALIRANNLNTGECGLSDGSSPGDWRLPNVREFESLLHVGFANPALPNTAGTGQWTSENPFLFTETGWFQSYWTSTLTTLPPNGELVYWSVRLETGVVFPSVISTKYAVWPVKGDSAAPARAPVAKTGQTASDPEGAIRDDGELQKGVAWPGVRLENNNDGTITDVLTGLVWLRLANCAAEQKTWAEALQALAELNSTGSMNGNNCGDGSNGGSHQTDWRLPNRRELFSLIDFGKSDPAMPVSDFSSVALNGVYWTSTSKSGSAYEAFTLDLGSGRASSNFKDGFGFVWAVRAGVVKQVATPVFSPAPGRYDSSQQVEITCNTPDAAIYYTTNGDNPTESSTPYAEQINIDATTTLKARAYKNNWTPSYIATGKYVIGIEGNNVIPYIPLLLLDD